MYKPGDQIRFRIPANSGETPEVWGYVLQKSITRQPDCVPAIIDEFMVINRNPKYQTGSVVAVPVTDIIAHIPADPRKPVLRITLMDGVLVDLTRVDGNTNGIRVQVEEDDTSAVYHVDHRGRRMIPEAE